jgi:threonine synthase
MPWRCPHETGDRRHVLLLEDDGGPFVADELDDNPFVRFRHQMAWWAFGRSRGMADDELVGLVNDLDEELMSVDDTGFAMTPYGRSPELSDLLGFTPYGGVWIKDETGNVAGSQKARHLFSILLHLRIAEFLGLTPWKFTDDRPALAISSCGNAAIAASTLAAAVDWPIDVFIPEWAGGVVVDILDELGARVNRCPRRPDDPAGDPTVLRFREAVAAGAIPFSVQGPENALCLDGGRTIGWEIADQIRASGSPSLDAVFVQVGGGAFAASVSRGLSESGMNVPLYAVQTQGCAPLARAWATARHEANPAANWATHMWPWESEPHSLADGILDDETYDWVADVDQLRRTSGEVVVASEDLVVLASTMGVETTGIPVSPTGTAGLAGLLAAQSAFTPNANVAVMFSGIDRSM